MKHLLNNLQTKSKLLCLCETWLTDVDAVYLYKIDEYCPAQVINRKTREEVF